MLSIEAFKPKATLDTVGAESTSTAPLARGVKRKINCISYLKIALGA